MWKTIKENNRYEVSDLGQVRNKLTGRILVPYSHTRGYLKVCLMNNGVKERHYIHRLVASNFLGDVNDLQVDHLNMVKTDNRLSNLEIVSQQENINRYWKAVRLGV